MKKGFWLEARSIVALAVCLLALAEIIDLTIVAVAIPHIMGALGCNVQEVSLVTTSYILAAAVFIMTTGYVSNRFGSKKTILASAVIFGIASILCGFATNLNEMIIFRSLQGIGGAYLPSMAQGYIASNFDEEERPKMMNFLTLSMVLGPIVGPIMGGYLVNQYSWRCIFFVNVPICITAFALVFFLMKETITSKINFDTLSFSLMAIGFGSLEYFIDEGNNNDWFNSHKMIIILIIGLTSVGFFIWRGILGKSIVNLKLFLNFNFVLSCLFTFVFMLLISASLAFYPTLLQNGYNFPVDLAGYITAPRGIAAVIGAIIGGKLSTIFDKRVILLFGVGLFACSCFIEAHFGTSWNMSSQLLACAIMGAGMSITISSILQIAFTGITSALSNDAGGVFNFFRNIGSSVGTSIASTMISRQQQVSWNDLSTHLAPFNPNVQQLQNGVLQGQSLLQQTGVMSQLVLQQTFVLANINLFYFCGCVALALIVVPYFLAKPAKGNIEVHMH